MKIITGSKESIHQYLNGSNQIILDDLVQNGHAKNNDGSVCISKKHNMNISSCGEIQHDTQCGYYCIHPSIKAHVWSYQLMSALIAAIPAECEIIPDFEPTVIEV
jgi:hypothetical protein